MAGLVLAGGQGRRFGSTKQLAPVEGRPLVAHAVAAAVDGGLDPILVVVGHDADAVAAAARAAGPVRVVPNPDHAAGQATSLRAGIGAASRMDVDGVVVLLADEPDVPAAAVRAVAVAVAAGTPVVRTRYADGVGHPVGFHRVAFEGLAAVTGDEGARSLLHGAAEVPGPGTRPRDVDTPQDLRDRRG